MILLAALIGTAWVLGNSRISQSGGILQSDAAGSALPGENDAIVKVGFAFREVSKSSGIAFTHRAPVFDHKIDNIMPDIASVGASASVADADGDGWPDIYLTNSESGAKNALYINQKDGAFRDVAGIAGVADLNRPDMGASMGSIWGDVDNDGREDLFIYKYGYVQLFHNDGPGADGIVRFTDISQPAGVRRWMNSNTACFFDYDRDGLLDLYIGGYYRDDIDLWHLKSTKFRQESMEFAKNGGHNYLYKNLGGGKFKDVTAETNADTTRWTLAVGAADFNDDGWPDLYIANDFGVEMLLLNEEGKRFKNAESAGLSQTSKSGMCVAIGDCNNSGSLDVFVTNITKAGFNAEGNNLRMNRLARTGQFVNMAEGEVADCGWAWGAQFGDFNNDGFADLFVANGYISASRSEDYWYQMSRMGGGTGGLIEDAANWPPMGDRSYSGYERSRVLINDGNGAFSDVAETVGVRDLLDGRSVCLADLFQKGCVDVIVANQKAEPLIYHSIPDPRNHWIQFTFASTKSNKSAIGVDVTLEWRDGATGRRQRRATDGGCGFSSQNERKLHFGLGASPSALHATVRWPSGIRQALDNLEIDRMVRIVEPEK